MSEMHDQPARQPRAGGAAGDASGADPSAARPGTGAGTQTSGRAETGQPADTTRRYVPRQGGRYHDVSTGGPRGAALGLTIAASVFMMLSGVLGFFEGLAAIIRGSFYVVLPNYAFSLSAVGRGWVQLIIGAFVFAAGVALLADQMWARVTGLVLASFSLVANFVFLPYYPVWAIVVIAVDAFVIWALLAPRTR